MNLNPLAVICWALFTIIGHLIGGITGAEIGLGIGLLLTLIGSFV